MKTLNINTHDIEKDSSSINNVHSFTTITRATSANYYSTSTSCIEEKIEYANKKYSRNFYTINLDWFQFLCQTDKNGNVLESYSSERIKITKNQTHNNPNFKYKYTVALDFCNLCDIYAIPINTKHKKNEISVKVLNSQLYTKDWSIRINYVLTELDFIYLKLSKIDFALDGRDLILKMDLFRRYLRTKTIQINNENLSINGTSFNKAQLRWESYIIGSKKYQKTAELYNKTKEIKVSGKQYIADFWKENGLDILEDIGRFELKLGTRHLSKYQFNSFTDFCEAGYLGQILFEEVGSWLKFYQVSLETVKNHRKDIAIKKGKELKFIYWYKIPQLTMPLDKVVPETDGINEAKKSITRAIGEIQKGYAIDSTATLINFVEATATEYQLYYYAIQKINFSLHVNSSECESLKSLADRLLSITENISLL